VLEALLLIHLSTGEAISEPDLFPQKTNRLV
jgi:hypothetical protein